MDSKSLFDLMRQDVSKFNKLGHTLIVGDMNARIASHTPDFIEDDKIDDYTHLPDDQTYHPELH